MANEIDLYKDLKTAEKMFEVCKRVAKRKGITKPICNFWKSEIKNITKEIKEKYPDLKL